MELEDSLVDIAIRRTLASLAWAGLVLAGHAFAKDVRTTSAVQLEAEVIPPGPREDGPGPDTVAMTRPKAGGADVRVGERQPFVDEETDAVFGNCAPGPGCELCAGGAACPPSWYIENDVRVLTRSRPRKDETFTQRFEQVTPLSNQLQLISFVNANANPPDPADVFGVKSQTVAPGKAMTLRQLSFDDAPGYRVTIGHYLGMGPDNRDRFLEFSFWGLNSWQSSRAVSGTLMAVLVNRTYTRAELTGGTPIEVSEYNGNLLSPFPLTTSLESPTAFDAAISHAFNEAMLHRIEYDSTINNYEANAWFRSRVRTDRLVVNDGRWRRECTPGWYFSYMAGLRLVEIHEQFTFASEAPSYGVNADQSRGALQGVYRGAELANTTNDLLGFQIGGELMWRHCRWSAGIQGKVGPYVNAAEMARRTVINGPDGYFNVLERDNRVFPSVLGEFGAVATYQFRPNLVGRASYDFLWAGGVALAPDQLTFVNNAPVDLAANQGTTAVSAPPGIANHGTIFYHGITLGLEYSW
jgi:hypothetical protein